MQNTKRTFGLTNLILLFAFSTMFLSGCALVAELTAKKKVDEPAHPYQLQEFVYVDAPLASADPKVFLGGMSGLFPAGKNTKTGELQFYSITDRGPNAWTVDIDGLGKALRPFPVPNFNPRILKIELNSDKKTFRIISEIPLLDPNGKPLTGLPNIQYKDEKPIDLNSKALNYDLLGVDTEGVTVDDAGNFWVCEEYRPSILKFDNKGRLLKRYVPKNSYNSEQIASLNSKYKKTIVVEALPEVFGERKLNRGFEGIAFANNKIYSVLQSPLPIKGRKNDLSIRVVELDPKMDKVTGQAIYPLSDASVDKMGDLFYDKESKRFYTIEQSGDIGDKGVHNVYSFDFVSASADLDYRPELLDESELDKIAVKKFLEMNLVKAGYKNFEKVEGLSVLGPNRFAVINDDDFQISGEPDLKNKSLRMDYNRPTVLAIIEDKAPPSR